MMQAIQLLIICGAVWVTALGQVQAGLIFTIDNYDVNVLKFSISGTFDADTTGDLPGYLAIKNSWDSNIGTPTEFLNGSVGLSIPVNTLMIGGVAPSAFVQDNSGGAGGIAFLDSIFFRNAAGEGTPFLAGTVVTGSVTVIGAIGTFDPADQTTLQLVSGRNNGTNDWARWEGGAPLSSSAPEPSSLALLGIGGFSIACRAIRRRRKKTCENQTD